MPFCMKWSLFYKLFIHIYIYEKKKSKNLLFSMSLGRCRFFVRHLVVLLVCIICVDVKFYFLFISFHFSLLSLGVYSCMLCVNFIFMTLTLTSLNKFICTWKMKTYLSYNFLPIRNQSLCSRLLTFSILLQNFLFISLLLV